MAHHTATVLIAALLLVSVALVAAPTASAERVTGCADGWHTGDDDCFLGDIDVGPDCISIRECDPNS